MIPATDTYKSALAAGPVRGKMPVFITIEGYDRVFTNYKSGIDGQVDWIVSIDDFDYTVNDLDGGADTAQFNFTVQDRGADITGDFPSFVFEGKKVTVKIGLPGLGQSDFITIFTGYIDTVASANSNQEYYFSCSDITSLLTQVIYQTADNGLQTSSDNIKTVTGHPLDILTNILGTQIGQDSSLYDSTKINAYRDGPFSGIQFLFHITQAPAALDFIKNQILKPLGGYLWVTSEGKLTVNFFYPLEGPTPVATLGADSWTSIPSAEQTDMINTVQFQFDKDDADANATGNYLAQDTEEYGPSIALYGQFGEQVIQADGMRSAFQGYFISKLVARLIFLRYGFKNLKFDQNAAESIWSMILLEPGDLPQVTHPNIPDRKAGVMGITDKLFEVLNKSISFENWRVTYSMIDASYLQTFGNFLIAPDDEADYTLASSGDQSTYMFLSDDTDKYSNGDAAHGLG